jgi:heterodisulfide reductase subunit A-like polyferredoxin
MVTVGMPRFRLPREIRQADIEDITCLGIEIITSTPIGKELTLQDLQKSYEAILIAVGAHKNQKLGVPGEGLSGVINSITFLQALNLKEPVSVGKKVVVIGGGYTGIDSARTAVRLHCEQVLIVDRCAKEELAANREEVAETMEEGVEFEYLVAPVRIVGLDGKVAGVDFRYLKPGKRDLLARCHTTRISESEFFVEADTVIVAVGQRPDLSFLGGDPALTDGGKHVIVDPLTMATKVPGIFAAGDAARPSAPVIYAIADGRRAAVSIDRLLRGEDIKKGRTLGKIVPVTVDLDAINVTREVRQPMPRMLHEYRLGNFEEVDLGFTAEMALKEAKRCLSCAGCSECLECERACELKAIEHNATPKQIDIEVGAIAVGGKQGMQQVEVLEGIDITDEHSGIYLVRTSADEQLSPASAAAGIIMADLAQYPEFSLSTEKISKTDALRQTSGEIGNVEPRVGIFVCSCGNSISDVIDIPGVVQYCRKLDSAVFSQQIEYACTADAAEEIKGLARRHSLTHIVLAACSCCNLGQICFSCSDRRVQCKSNLVDSSFQNNVYYEFVNIREHCAWVHKSQPAAATAKAKRLIRAGLARAKAGQLQAKKNCDVAKGVLVVGGGLGGMQAAANLAAQGFYTVLIDNGEEKDNNLAEHNSLSEQVRSVRRRLEEELTRSRAIVLRETHPVGLDGTAGRYQVSVVRNGKSLRFAVGAIVVDLSSRQNGRSDVVAETELLSLLEKGIISGNGQKNGHPVLEPAVSRLPGVFLCGTGQAADVTEALTQGLAAASKASVLISKGVIDIEQTVAIVDRGRCRGCGTCESVCPFGAIRLEKREAINVYAARVEDALCRGCGICVARCPSGALSQNGYSDGQLIASLEAILTRR